MLFGHLGGGHCDEDAATCVDGHRDSLLTPLRIRDTFPVSDTPARMRGGCLGVAGSEPAAASSRNAMPRWHSQKAGGVP
jgi:hypothetical protein